MDVIAFIKTIYGWFCSLDIVDKIVGAIVSFFTTGLIKRIWEKLKPSAEEKAFKQAVKRWQSSSYVRGYYKKYRMKSISEFSDYVIDHHGAYDDDLDKLYRLYEEELGKTNEGKLFLQSL